MADYKLNIVKKAAKELDALPDPILKKIYLKLKSLPTDPFPVYSKKLKGSEKTYRIREGDYRIIYEVQTNEIMVIAAGHRREIYR